MPLQTRFWPYRPDRLRDVIGVYELGRGGYVLYIGFGKLKNRLQSHWRDPEKRFQQYRIQVTNDRRRARQIERRELLAYGDDRQELPKYNHEIPAPP